MKKSKKISLIVLSVLFVCVSILGCFSRLFDNQTYNVMFNFGVISREDNLLVHFINVGQGDAIAINLPDNKVMLIDTGTTSSKALINYLNERVLNSLKRKQIDYLVLTHADSDHVGGALSVVKNFDVNLVCMPIVDDTGENYTEFKNYLKANNIKNVVGYDILNNNSAGYEIKVFPPLSTKNKNDSCPVIKITFYGFSFLFTGDISEKVEPDFVTKYGIELDSDILKVAHHGSKTSSSIEFLEIVTPNYAVISSGNKFGHPTQEALDRLTSVNADIFRTDTLGDILFVAGKSYGLKEIDGDYSITGIKFKFIYMVLVVDGVILVCVLFVLLNTNNKKQKTVKRNTRTAKKAKKH